MTSVLVLVLATTFLYGLISLYSYLRAQARLRRLMPPSPPGLPILGNTLQVPFNEPWHVFQKWTEEYGELDHYQRRS